MPLVLSSLCLRPRNLVLTNQHPQITHRHFINMKISSAALPLLLPSWFGSAFHLHPATADLPTRRLSTPATASFLHPARPLSRTFSSSLQMNSLLSQEKSSASTEEAEAEILSTTDRFAVVRVRDDLGPADAVAVAAAASPVVGGETEEDRVELARALFAAKPGVLHNPNGGVIADGDLTGRRVSFPDNLQGLVVAHRHPIAFVLLDTLSEDTNLVAEKGMPFPDHSCYVSKDRVTIHPDSIPPGSTVDYLGRHVQVNENGIVVRAAAPITTEFDAAPSSRPIFVTIPKISDIGLINTPLVTGITAIDALTPIGRGQNMLVIGNQEEDVIELETGEAPIPTNKVNKRAWMMNLLKSVVNKRDSKLRCFYGLTATDPEVRSTFIKRLEEAGIRNDIVSVLSTHSNDGTTDLSSKKLEAAEAVAVAASACTLGEHYALTTGGDALVIIDDINLHKSLWDITTQQLVQIYGVDAVVKADLQGGSSSEMRGYFSGLIQRAARFNSKRGGGSVTLILMSTIPSEDEADNDDSGNSEDDSIVFDPSDFESMSEKIRTRIATLVKAKVPLTAANLRKIQIPIPRPSASEDAKRLALQHVDDLISMSDGQIWFDDVLAKMGRSPPLDPSRSITRVGVGADTPCRADAPALRTVAGSLRFQFQQATDMITRKDGSPNNPVSSGDTKQVLRQEAFLLAMHQGPNQTRKLSQECISLIAASRGYLDKVIQEGSKAGTPKGIEVMDRLMEYVESKASDAIATIDTSLEMSLEHMALIENAIETYFAK
eukprot:CCRYP_020186-RA/>CCRYP_020186-RA protein AED:0.12 eAED:0.12 QI:108/1/1/1/1/1/3/2977/774